MAKFLASNNINLIVVLKALTAARAFKLMPDACHPCQGTHSIDNIHDAPKDCS